MEVSATSANIGPGYDVWGIALNIKNSFQWEYAGEAEKEFRFEVSLSELTQKTGTMETNTRSHKSQTPANRLFIKSYLSLFQLAQKETIYVNVHIHLNVPISRGLGSSATVILAGLMIAGDVLRDRYQIEFSDYQIFQLAHQIEKHPDNIAAALWGGLVMNIPVPAGGIKPLKIGFQAPLKLIGIIPHYQTSTEDSRKVLPKQVPLNDVAFQSSRLSAMVHLFQKKEWRNPEIELIKICLDDRIHQPYRMKLLPGARETFDHWASLGVWGSYISGSGSTLLGFWPKDKSSDQLNLRKAMQYKGIDSTQVEFEISDQALF